MAERLGLVLHWFFALIGMPIIFIPFYLQIEDLFKGGELDGGYFIFMLIGTFVYLIGYSLRFILTGSNSLLPWTTQSDNVKDHIDNSTGFNE
jgi:hypothetical protein